MDGGPQSQSTSPAQPQSPSQPPRPGSSTSEFRLAAASVLAIIGGAVDYGVTPDVAAAVVGFVAAVYIVARTWAKSGG